MVNVYTSILYRSGVDEFMENEQIINLLTSIYEMLEKIEDRVSDVERINNDIRAEIPSKLDDILEEIKKNRSTLWLIIQDIY